MTTIHAERRKIAHFPKQRRNFDCDLNVAEDGKMVNIDINIPGVGKNQIEVCKHRPCIKKGVRVIPGHKELIHIVLPKNY